MKGWNGRILRVDLTRGKHVAQSLGAELALSFIGGRGLAVRVLWDEVPPGADPLGPYNKLILATGPLTGLPGVNTGKLVVAAKSPLTGGYGDGNIGSWAAVQIRRAGYDAIVIEGAARKPVYLYVEDDKVELVGAEDLWGLDAWEAERRLAEIYGRTAGVLVIGPAGENLVKYATVLSQRGRSGGRPGMGAVMGSKRLKAVVVKGSGEPPVEDRKRLSEVMAEAIREGRSSKSYGIWMKQGTTATVEWAQAASVLPAYNFSDGVFDDYEKIGGYMVEKLTVELRSCPLCFMPCGHWIPAEGGVRVEVDYENIAMLGSNIGLGDLGKVGYLNYLADRYGLDTISLGNVIGFLMEASEKGFLKDFGYRIEWGDFKEAVALVEDIVRRRGIGALAAEGVRRISEVIGPESAKFAVHVKGLEVSAYDCHAAPAMALSYATSPIGAHHKDSWVIAWEVQRERFEYSRDKVEKVVELQRIRGGWFESLVACRLAWVEVGVPLERYVELLKGATGLDLTPDYLNKVADRIYTLIRAYWIREYGYWDRSLDMPPRKWFEEPLRRGPLAGSKLDLSAYNRMLEWYYEIRGWDERGIPRRGTLEDLGLNFAVSTLDSLVGLKD